MKHFIVIITFSFLISSCCTKKVEENSHFPPEVQIIFTNKCATAGCHNDQSFENAAKLNLTSWEKLFSGAESGSVAIPYASLQSSIMQFVNTYNDLGLITGPSMPLNEAVLSRNEVIAIKSWIDKGCPNNKGEIPFASNSDTRAKAYITNQGCDLVSVIDAKSKMVMRYVKVGKDPILIEQPHNIKVSPDGKYWYVCFSNGAYLQKFDAATDSLVGEVNLTFGKWNVVTLSANNQTAFVSDLSSIGRIAVVNLQTMNVDQVYSSGLFSNPHGIACSQTSDTLYVTAQYGNMLYRIIRSIPQVDQISIQKGVAPTLTPNLLDPHEVVMSTDFKKYFISCQASNEIRVMDAKTDTLLKAIPVGIYPLEMAISKKRNLLFVTCQEDTNPVYPFFKGSVYVIDLNTMAVVKKVYEKFYQPHGIGVDDNRDLLYVSSANSNPSGPAPHHASECAGRNGFFHIINLNNWETIGSFSELSVFPYSIAVRE